MRNKAMIRLLVWRDMDQRSLDEAYDQAIHAPNRDRILKRLAVANERARMALGRPERFAYGEHEWQGFDVYRASTQALAPINIVVYGNAWRRSNSANSALAAEPLVGAGAHCVFLDFDSVDETDGDLTPVCREVSRAIAWVWRNASKFGGSRDRLFISAHSSGAHLAACALTCGWREERLPADFCKGAILAAGLYDLGPVRLSKSFAHVAFTDEMESNLSPIRHLDGLTTPLILAYGGEEAPEFQRQTREFHTAARATGKRAELLIAEGYNHFELVEEFTNPYGVTGRATLHQMGLA